MRKVVILSLFLFVVISAPIKGISTLNPHYASAIAADGMARVQLGIKKLRSSMANMKDFDELEKSGMSKKDVDRMRRAMERKIKQLTDDAIEAINAL